MKGQKFIDFENYLKNCNMDCVELSFEQIENIIGQKLSYSAYNHKPYWHLTETHTFPLAWYNTGYKIDKLNLIEQKVRFIREDSLDVNKNELAMTDKEDVLNSLLQSSYGTGKSFTLMHFIKNHLHDFEDKQKLKKTGETVAKASEYIMTLQHNELSNELVAYLKRNGYANVITDDEYVDIKARDSYGKQIFFELKTAISVKFAIRQALGQLLEYNHYPNKNEADRLIIVTRLEISNEDRKYLTGLRTIYNIPVYYQQFDMANKVLTQEY